MELAQLKSAYEKLKDKHKLPSFDKINNDFDIDKIDRESDVLLKVIRKVMLEKIINSLNFIEMIYNPANAPRVYQNFLRTITQEDKKIIDRIYSALSEISVDSLDLEIESSEKKEADLIVRTSKIWDDTRKDFHQIINKIKNPVNSTAKKEKSYFG